MFYLDKSIWILFYSPKFQQIYFTCLSQVNLYVSCLSINTFSAIWAQHWYLYRFCLESFEGFFSPHNNDYPLTFYSFCLHYNIFAHFKLRHKFAKVSIFHKTTWNGNNSVHIGRIFTILLVFLVSLCVLLYT